MLERNTKFIEVNPKLVENIKTKISQNRTENVIFFKSLG
jgi:hypothetical protein